MARQRVAVIGAGVGGLVAALQLAAQGADVVVLERAPTPGGKLREIAVAGARIDAGPTVFTMRWVFDAIFASAGSTLEQHLALQPVEVLARHAWSATERLDLYADPARAADAIGEFAGAAEARRFASFSARAARVFATLDRSFIQAPSASPFSLARRSGLRHLADLWQIQPFTTLWQALCAEFTDPRLRQLFGRYATYCGSSPFLAPATLMLIAHVEQAGVWLIEGGMHKLAQALASLASAHGARFRYATHVSEIVVTRGRVSGVRLASGELLDVDAVVANADVAAVAQGQLGASVAHAVPRMPREARSLSAVTWTLLAPTRGFPLHRHNVFFSRDYRAEFDDLFQRNRLPRNPTVYVCAQDRGDADDAPPPGAERLLCLVNAPANGERGPIDSLEIAQCEASTFELLARCGLEVARNPATSVLTTPVDFAQLFPATGGALYGRASHGWRASFQRPSARTRIPGLCLAGGSTHPGAGVPMAALSGAMAATALQEDWASTSRLHAVAMHGGMSTR